MNTSTPQSSGIFWKAFLATILVVFLVGMSISFRMAGNLDGKLADRDYYEHGKHYDAMAAKERNALALGWRMHTVREADSLVVTVTAQNGDLVRGGELHFVAGAEERSGAPSVPFHETAPGRYFLPLAAIGGQKQGRLLFSTVDAALATKIKVID